MAYDPNCEETKTALDAAVAKAVEKLEAKNRELLAEKRRQGEGKVDAAELDRVETELATAKEQLAAAQREVTKQTKAATDAAKALEAEQAHTNKLLVSDGLNAALRDAGVTDPRHLKAAAAMLRADLNPAVVIEGDARVAKVGDKALADAVKAWAQTDDGRAFVAAPAHYGGGAGGGAGPGAGAVTLAGTPAERVSALKQRHPELA